MLRTRPPRTENDQRIGENIKRIRRAKSMTLQELSELSTVSVATLSKIENAKVNGSFNTIYKVARGLGVLVTDIVSGRTPSSQQAAKVLKIGAGQSELHATDLYDYFIQAGFPDGDLNSYVMTIKTRAVPDLADWSNHEGEEVVYVLAGAIDLHLEGRPVLPLQTGDSACFDCGQRHAFVRTSPGAARILSVSTRGPNLARSEFPSVKNFQKR